MNAAPVNKKPAVAPLLKKKKILSNARQTLKTMDPALEGTKPGSFVGFCSQQACRLRWMGYYCCHTRGGLSPLSVPARREVGKDYGSLRHSR